MSHLLILSIGPVQDFIAAARRTNDLKAGSELLEQCAKAAAKKVEQQGSQLIFPAGADEAAANKILARIENGEPCQLAENVEQSVRDFLIDKWRQVTERYSSYLNHEIAENQIHNLLEFYSAWVPETGDYPEDRKRVELLLASRKALRDFIQPLSAPGLPKSPLDSARDCALILQDGKTPSFLQKPPLRLKKRETLDAVSLLKRLQGSSNNPVPSTTLIALRSTITEQKEKSAAENWKKIRLKIRLDCEFEDVMFSDGIEQALEEVNEARRTAVKSALESFRKDVLGGRSCEPYYSILIADGDKMGECIERLTTIESHQEFSRKLSMFASMADDIVKKNRGYCIYTGGDDVVALLPVTTAISCASELAKEFTAHTSGSLSAGLAVVHHKESLQLSLDRARAAEKEAKKKRNALAIALYTRGGQPIRLEADPWSSNPSESWRSLTEAMQANEVSRGFPYELRELAREFRGVVIDTERIRQEAIRVLNRKQGGESKKIIENEIMKIDTADGLEKLSLRLVTARFLGGYLKEGKND